MSTSQASPAVMNSVAQSILDSFFTESLRVLPVLFLARAGFLVVDKECTQRVFGGVARPGLSLLVLCCLSSVCGAITRMSGMGGKLLLLC